MNDSSEDLRAVFEEIYKHDHWKGGSGEGSQVDVTKEYRAIVATVLAGNDIHSVIDLGCGDWQFSRLVDWSSVQYLGIDIVPDVIQANDRLYRADGVHFECADIRAVTLPRADLLICKDVLQHWDLDSIRRFLQRSRSRYRYRLITNDIASTHIAPSALNSEIAMGAWRTLDLEQPPFGERASWREDFDIRGEWTKRTILFVRKPDRMLASLNPRSALGNCRRRLKSNSIQGI